MLHSPKDARFRFRGCVGDRIRANQEAWLLPAPAANPAMLEMFRDRDRLPRRSLLPWSGEFAGKYLTAAVLGYRLTRDRALLRSLERFVDELTLTQDEDGYLGPHPWSERLTGKTIEGH